MPCSSIVGVTVILGFAIALLGGCQSTNPPRGSEAQQTNASESAPYAAGTGVSSSSFDRHPRFYTGGAEQSASPAATQPAGEP